MQVERLLEIAFYLLNRKSATAGELATRFNVSKRTIYRDINTLSLSGIPIYTSKGTGGGIKVMDEFVLNKSLLSEGEQKEILSSLHGLVTLRPGETSSTLTKLEDFFNKSAHDWIEVDFSRWCPDSNYKFNNIKTAILESRIVEFDYYSTYGEKTRRRAEPIKLYFKSHSWYLHSFCLSKNSFRLFKLSRIKDLHLTDEVFIGRDCHEDEGEHPPQNEPPIVVVTLKIAPEMAFRVYDEFDNSQIIKNEDGSLTVTIDGWWEDRRLYSLIFSYGEYAVVLEPEHIKQTMKEKIKKMHSTYF